MTHLLLLVQATKVPEAHTRVPEMTTGSFVFLGLAWAAVIGLTVFCFVRVLGGRPGKA